MAKILEKKAGKEYGDLGVHPCTTPVINLHATELTSLITWKSDVHEPVFTAKLSKAEVQNLVNTPFDPPYYPSHTQSTERTVKQVTYVLL